MRFHQLALVTLSVLIASPSSLRAETLRITNGEWPPFTSQSLPQGGPLSRVVADAFKQVGVTVEYGYFPWKRAYEYARNGTWDGSVGWARDSVRVVEFVMSDPVIYADKVLFYRKAVPIEWSRVEDLKRWRLGAAAGYSYGEEWDTAVRSGVLQVESVALDEQNLRKLLDNRLDAIAIDLEVGLYLLRTAFTPSQAEQITFHPRRLSRSLICLTLSRKNPASQTLVERFNQGLAALHASGRFDHYFTEYHLTTPVVDQAIDTGKRVGRVP